MSKAVGTVKWFSDSRGYGFIINEYGADVMVHYKSILIDGFKTLAEHQQVEYLEVKSAKGLQAVEVVPLC